MKQTIAGVLMLALVGCGTAGPSDSEIECSGAGLASLGIDPLGRGDGLDLPNSNYDGRCYEDDELEANRPQLPDPRDLAADDAQAVARDSQAAADLARARLDDAKAAVEESFAVTTNAPAPGSSSAGEDYILYVTAAKFLTEEAYQIGLALLAPSRPTTFKDIAEHPNKFIKALATEFLDDIVVLVDTPAVIEIATELLTEVIKAKMLKFLKNARDLALYFYESATEQVDSAEATANPAVPTADPVLLQELEDAQLAYDEAYAQAIADGKAALDARIFASNAPSDLPPCDSEELRQTLEESLCLTPFVNPVTPEEEEMAPGTTARLDAFVAEVCAAVTFECPPAE